MTVPRWLRRSSMTSNEVTGSLICTLPAASNESVERESEEVNRRGEEGDVRLCNL